MRLRAWWFLLAALAPVPGPAAAQSPDLIEIAPPWMRGWSPLMPLADLGRVLPSTPAFTDLLAGPAPRIGLFWTAGIPVGVGADVVQSRFEGRAGRAEGQGAYRRALDADDDGAFRISGIGWRPAGHGAVAGRVLAVQRRTGRAGHAAWLDPHRSDPFGLADSAVPAMRRLAVSLEGAGAWRFGVLDAGLAAGVAVDDHRTEEARFPRLGRASTPGIAGGVAVRLPLTIRLAAHARWTGGAETWILAAQPAPGEVYRLAGYSDPTRGIVEPPRVAFRRGDREASAVGGGIEGRLLGARWVLHVRRERRTDVYTNTRDVDPPQDRWDARGWNVGGALQTRVLGDAFLLTAEARSRTVAGEARRSDLEGVFFRADEQVIDGSLELRYQPRTGAWSAVAAYHLRRETLRREDFLAGVYTDIRAWTPAGRLEIARDVGALSAGAGAALAGYTPRAVIPDPTLMGPLYQELLAQEHSLYALPALPHTIWFGLAWRAGPETTVALDAAREQVGRRGGTIDLAFAPTGTYTRWALDLRVVLHR